MTKPFVYFLRLLALVSFISLPFTALADDTIYTKVDENPVPVRTPPPRYPDSLKREGVSGVVAVAIVIDETGSVINTAVSKSSHPDFERPALEAVSKWKFKPAKKDGAAVKVRVTLPLRFSIED
jgi:TonB family C-terminal domain